MAEPFTVKKPQSFNKTIRMPEEMIGRLEALADSKDVSFNQVVLQCCQYALDHLAEDSGGGD